MIFFLLWAMTTTPPNIPRDTAFLYQNGSYRQVVSLVTQRPLGFEDTYRLASSLLMINDIDRAWEVASSLSLDQRESLHQFLMTFLVSQLLEKSSPTNTSIAFFSLTNWLTQAPRNPFLSTNTIEKLFWLSWNLDPALTPPPGYAFLSPTYEAWKRFLEGDVSSLPVILSNSTLSAVGWERITNQLATLSLPSTILPALWPYLKSIPPSLQARVAEAYLDTLPPSSTWKAEITYAMATKNRSAALSRLEKILQQPSLSLEDYQTILAWANQLKAYDLAEKTASKAMARFGSLFHAQYARSLVRQNKKETLLQWYQANPDVRNREVDLTVFRILIENNDPRLSLWLEKQNPPTSPAFILVQALLFLDKLQSIQAYPLLLRLLSDYPYTYEWWVARDYAARYHSLYASLFTNWYTNTTNTLSRLSLQERLLTTLALADITGELIAPQTFSNDLAHYREAFFSTHFGLSSDQARLFDRLLSLTNSSWTNYPRELSAYLDSQLQTPQNRYLFAWYGYPLYEKANAIGIAIARLDYFIRRYIGREGILLLPEEWQKRLFPLSPLADILPVVSNTNEALWVLAAYRQESHFRKDVISSAGAYGYAQLMPSTARLLAKNLRQPELTPYDYQDNILMGNTLYAYLFKKFGWIPYGLAAYNAGEGAVTTWKKRYPFRSPLWIECIPYDETRNYVRIIWQNVAFYRRFYGETLVSVPFTTEAHQ